MKLLHRPIIKNLYETYEIYLYNKIYFRDRT